MESDIAAVKSTLDAIQSDGLVTAIDTGWWGAASGLGDATGNAFSGISQYLDDLIVAHQAVVDRITQSASTYADTEDNNVALVSSVGSGGSAPVPSAGSTSSLAPLPSGGTGGAGMLTGDRKSTRLNSSHVEISYAVFCLK